MRKYSIHPDQAVSILADARKLGLPEDQFENFIKAASIGYLLGYMDHMTGRRPNDVVYDPKEMLRKLCGNDPTKQ